MTSKPIILLILAVALAGAAPALAQEQQPLPGAADVPAVSSTAVGDYQVGPGDLLSIKVTGVREFDQTIRVSNSGRIRVPYVGIMFAAGMTTFEIEREIVQQIKEHELVNEPTVRVQVDQHRARPAYAVGEVSLPGQFMITDEMYLLDLVTRAGGLTGMADSTAVLYRRAPQRPGVTARLTAGPPEDAPPPPGEGSAVPPSAPPAAPAEAPSDAQLIPINLDALRDGTKPEMNIPLQGGDVLYVPRRMGKTFYIIGDVRNPGAYGMPRQGVVTAAQAVVYAGGPFLTAKNHSGFLMRHDQNGVRQAIPIDFIAIIRGKKPDVPIEPDDIIFIPTSAAKTIGIGLLNLVPRLLQQFIIF